MEMEELATWAAYFGMEESRDEEAQWRAGMIAATVASCATGRSWTPEDFRPVKAEPITDPEEIKRRLMAWTKAHGGRIRAKE